MTAVIAHGLAKHYRIYPGPRSLLRELVTGNPAHSLVRALEDISFQVEQGEAFGVVGENGAGKSTLLKVLTGTTVPSAGTLRVEGRVSALLELGAGFHHEFSGRENVYFSGALSGYSRPEIAAREEEIIEFSELERVIDNPVKTYSSGMILRLGFAIATGFEPTILIIDEALAVGDQRFQKRCTDRILDFKQRGATILFCSHNLHLVKSLCDRALWLERGRERDLGDAGRVADRFADYMRSPDPADIPEAARQSTHFTSSVTDVEILGPRGAGQAEFQPGDTLELAIEAEFTEDFGGRPAIGVAVVRNDGTLVYSSNTAREQHKLSETGQGRTRCRFVMPNLQLLPGTYYCNVFTTDEASLLAYHSAQEAVRFSVTSEATEQGVVRLDHYWE